MTETQSLLKDLVDFKTRIETYLLTIENCSNQLSNIERILNDIRHLRENFTHDELLKEKLLSLDLKEHELLKERRKLKDAILMYEKNKSVLRDFIQLTEKITGLNEQHTSYTIKTKEGAALYDFLVAEGLQATTNIRKANYIENESKLALIEKDTQKKKQTVITTKKAIRRIEILHAKKRKVWVAKDLVTGQELFKHEKFSKVVSLASTLGLIEKYPKSVHLVIKKYIS